MNVLLGDSLVEEGLALALVPIFSLIFKSILKPNKRQLKLFSQVISLMVMILLKWVRNKKNEKIVVPRLNSVRDELAQLTGELSNRKRNVLG